MRRSAPFPLTLMALLPLSLLPTACGDGRGNPESDYSVVSSSITQADGSTVPVFADDFNRTGALGAEWSVIGAASANGSAATLTSALTYAFWNGLPSENTSVSISLSAPTASWVGVFTRASMAEPDRSHYAAFVSSGGIVTLARREEWSYTFLAEKAGSFPSGTHKLTLTASNSNPVQLGVAVDGVEVLRYDDASPDALSGAGASGIFDYQGSSQAVDKFEVAFGVHFSDDFNRSGAIGSNWTNADGSFTCNGTKAISANVRSYAAWVGTASNPVVKVTMTTPIASTYVGVFTRGAAVNPNRDHYAAFVDPSGIIKLRRRNNSSYTSLATGPSFPSGTHVIGLSTAGTNPVQLTVTLDGDKIIEYNDSSSSRLASGMKVGIFDYNGAGQPIDDFVVADGAESSDDFDTGTTLGSDWTVSAGSFSVSTSRAHSTAAQSYAFIGPDALNATAAVELDSTWLMQTFSGVTLRAANGTDTHYAGGVDANGSVRISRRNGGTYTHLTTGSSFPSGVHALSLTATGTNPVQLSLKIDGIEWLHYDDSSTSRVIYEGRAGIFSNEAVYSSGQYFGAFDLFGDRIWLPLPPVLGEIPPQAASVGVRKRIFLRATDVNGGQLTVSGTNLPSGATVTNFTRPWPGIAGRSIGVFSWTPTSSQVGVHTPTITVTDDTGRTDSQVVTITVAGDCDPISTFETASPAPTPLRTFYVDGVNGLDSNSGLSETSAVKTIQHGLCLAKGSTAACPNVTGAGSAVLILRKSDGSAYEESPSITDLEGTVSAPIWIGGKVGDMPILSDNKSGPANDKEVLKLVRPKYVILHDMIIGKDTEATRSHGINIDDGSQHDSYVAHHVIIRNLSFKKIGDGDFTQNCLKISGLNDFYIFDNTFNICGKGVEGGDGLDAVGCHDGVITRNKHTGRRFVQAKGGSRNIEIRRNTSTLSLGTGDDNRLSYNLGGNTGTGFFRPSLTCDDGEPDCDVSDGSLHYEARHIRLIGNLIRGGTGIRFEGCYQCLAANNTIIDPVDRFFHVVQGDAADDDLAALGANGKFVEDGRVYNNIFYFSADSIKKASVSFSEPPPALQAVTQTRWDTFVFKSNLYCNRTNPSTCEPTATDLLANVVDGSALQGAGNDPQFASMDGYPLKTTSPAKYTGTSLTAAPSVLAFTGSSATTVEDLRGVCYASPLPSRGAREIP